MESLFLACIALLIGPVLYQFIFKNHQALKAVDGFVCVSIAGLLIIHFVEDFDFSQGWIALLLLIVGLVGPLLLERFFSKIQREVHMATLVLGAFGFLMHTALDGAAVAPHGVGLSDSHQSVELSLAAAIVIHRLPVGLTIWWLLKPRFGAIWGALGLCLAIAGTVGGYVLASSPVVQSLDYTFPWVQALVAGSILHVVFFRFHLHDEDHQEELPELEPEEKATWICAEGVGNLIGFIFLGIVFFFLTHEHSHVVEDLHHLEGGGGETLWNGFLFLAAESAPALLFAYFAGIFIYGFFPESSLQWMKRGSRIVQSGKGMLVGLPLPICSCGVLPYYQTLVKRGAPPAAAVAFLIATPELGIDAVLLSFPLLGLNLTLIRLAASAIIAFVVAWIVSRYIEQKKSLPVIKETEELDVLQKVKKGAQFALIELVDTTAPWMLVGLVLATFAEPLMSGMNVELSDQMEVLFFSCMGLVVYVCASGATPLVAALLATGVSPGAGLAFLLTGPATNISTFGVFSELHGKKIALLFASLMIVSAVGVGMITNILLPEYISVLHSDGHAHGLADISLLKITCLILVGALFLSSLVRQGGRQFFGHVLGDQGVSLHGGHTH